MEVNVAADCSEVLRAMFSAGCSTLLRAMLSPGCSPLLAGSSTSPREGRRKARMARVARRGVTVRAETATVTLIWKAD